MLHENISDKDIENFLEGKGTKELLKFLFVQLQ